MPARGAEHCLLGRLQWPSGQWLDLLPDGCGLDACAAGQQRRLAVRIGRCARHRADHPDQAVRDEHDERHEHDTADEHEPAAQLHLDASEFDCGAPEFDGRPAVVDGARLVLDGTSSGTRWFGAHVGIERRVRVDIGRWVEEGRRDLVHLVEHGYRFVVAEPVAGSVVADLGLS